MSLELESSSAPLCKGLFCTSRHIFRSSIGSASPLGKHRRFYRMDCDCICIDWFNQSRAENFGHKVNFPSSAADRIDQFSLWNPSFDCFGSVFFNNQKRWCYDYDFHHYYLLFDCLQFFDADLVIPTIYQKECKNSKKYWQFVGEFAPNCQRDSMIVQSTLNSYKHCCLNFLFKFLQALSPQFSVETDPGKTKRLFNLFFWIVPTSDW